MNRRFFRPGLLAAILLMVFALPAPSLADDDERTYGLGLARVTYISGDTLFNSPDTEDWAALSPNFALRDGDRLWAGEDSKLEVGFSGGHYAWLNYDSELDMVRLERGDRGDLYQVGLPSGEASFIVKRLGSKNASFQVDTPNASVRAYGRARFRVSSLSDGTSQVGVIDGSVEVESDEGITDLEAGEMAEVTPDGEVHIASLPATDDWDRWVDSRAHRYARPGRSARYLPAELEAYSHEFDEGGRWVRYPEYGRVWVPAVATGWSPYSNGRWVWRADDYVWLPYDPWYAPFHYGRWTWSVSLGWFWAPPLHRAVYWSPGYVSWVWGPDYVGWVPLAPREVYYGYGYYGPHSVNIRKTKVVNITNVYINSRVNNGVVVVNKNNFIRGDIKRVVIRHRDQNPFVNKRALRAEIGRPPVREIKVTRELRVPKPHIKLERRALPPERVERLAPIVKKRPVAREPKASVLKPGARPQKLDREVLKQRRIETRPAPFRKRDVAPAVQEREIKGRQPQERPVRQQDKIEPAEKGKGRGGDFEMPGRARPEPQKERGNIERPAKIEREVRPAPRIREKAEPPAMETVPVERERPAFRERAEQVAPPAARRRERNFEQPGRATPTEPAVAAEKEGKVKGEGKKKKEPKEKLKEEVKEEAQ